jgi:hypothetical protein
MRRITWAAALFLMGSPLVARAQGTAQPQTLSVGITQLPAAVQDTFLAEIGQGRVENLRKVATPGGDRYTGEVIRDGKVTAIEVEGSGVVLDRAQPRDETPEERASDR